MHAYDLLLIIALSNYVYVNVNRFKLLNTHFLTFF